MELQRPREPVRVQLEERLLSLHRRRLAKRRAGERRAHHEQVHLRRDARQLDLRLAPVDLPVLPGAWTCGTQTSPTGQPISRLRART